MAFMKKVGEYVKAKRAEKQAARAAETPAERKKRRGAAAYKAIAGAGAAAQNTGGYTKVYQRRMME
jgi:hypothetical protein